MKKFSRGDVVAKKKYEIVRFLGEGLTAHTYLARHIASGKELVMKFLKPNLVSAQQDRERLRQLFERARAVRHEMLTRYGELGIHDSMVYLTEEYFESKSLRELIDAYVEDGKAFTLQEACQLAMSVLEACEVGHNAGLVHRNLKPENVLVHTKRTGPAANAKVIRTVKITGLGLAGVINPTIFADSFVNRQEAPYLAPELSGFDQECGPQADVYSVGVILYELLCGQRPMGTYLSPTQLRDDLPEHLDDIVEVSLAHNSEDRYPMPRDMINDIQRSFSLEMQSGRPVASFRNIMIGLGVAISLAVLFGGWAIMSEKPDPRADALHQDETLRRQVQSQNPPPSDAEIEAMLKLRPDMVYVPEGRFVRGRLKAEGTDVATLSEPMHAIQSVDAFYIDRYEYPNKPGATPNSRISWSDALASCQARGKRLCTDLEWEKACKGLGNFIYAFGDVHPEDCAKGNPVPVSGYNIDREGCSDELMECRAAVDDPYTLGSRKDCTSLYGVFHMSDGLREWTATAPSGKDGRRLAKGGMRGNQRRGSRCAFSVDESVHFSGTTLGFRCCVDAKTEVPKPVEEPEEAEGEEAEGEAAEGEAAEGEEAGAEAEAEAAPEAQATP